MTYRELLSELKNLNQEQLDLDVTVMLLKSEEYYPADFDFSISTGGVLDPDDDYPLIVVN